MGEKIIMEYATQFYFLVKAEYEGLDSMYEDALIHLIEEYGIHVLKENELLETCGVINGRQLYVLCDK